MSVFLRNLREKYGIHRTLGDWSKARRRVFYRPIKQQIRLRLDADLIDWFKTHATQGEGYQIGINRALRDYVALRHKSTSA